ncbi:hypothetical protein [Paraglaciecola sp. MB-3u-78]|jgi:hypothetical protein|uniref:hypothetical protein n=1 Tax=Paraglaciecola sp. MB-3u-78 TaxID=2058332 RepID=UPI000C336C6E|nr:hypothetical protein [Paraglaciecola sp. MB-3u-78]PKG99899.1 hypothetical protein CXF95_04370 [Paraglaciecola sp. MB-3u-78]
MLKSEVKLATLIRRIVGRGARVVLGCPQLSSDEKGFTKPHIYLRFNQFCDATAQVTGSVYAGRRVITEGKLTGFREERPGHISIHIDLISDDYLETQELRQKLLGAVLVFLDTLKVLQLSDPKDGNVELSFRDIAPSLRDFSINAIKTCQEPLYCGEIHYELNGFLHVCVKR